MGDGKPASARAESTRSQTSCSRRPTRW